MISPVLQIEGLSVSYPAHGPVLRNLSLNLEAAEIAGVTGASGCGKSTLALAITGLLPEVAQADGRILLEGRNLLGLPEHELRKIRGRHLSMVWQEPRAALNPVLRCGRQVTEVVQAHEDLPARECRRRAMEMLAAAGLPERAADAYPHELSGGQLQRLVLAQALVCRPGLVIADEPTSSLDTVTQAEIMQLIADLQRRLGTAFLFITHNPKLLTGLAGRIYRMRDGALCA